MCHSLNYAVILGESPSVYEIALESALQIQAMTGSGVVLNLNLKNGINLDAKTSGQGWRTNGEASMFTTGFAQCVDH